MVWATILACTTASTTVLAPVTTSPDANVPFLVVFPLSSVINNPHLLVSNFVVFETILVLGVWLTATIIESHLKNSSFSSISLFWTFPSDSTTFSVLTNFTPSSVISNGDLNNSN